MDQRRLDAKRLVGCAALPMFGFLAAACILCVHNVLALYLLIELSAFLPVLGIVTARRIVSRSRKLPNFILSLIPNATMFFVVATSWPLTSWQSAGWLAAMCLVAGVVFWPFAGNIVRRAEYDYRTAMRRKHMRRASGSP